MAMTWSTLKRLFGRPWPMPCYRNPAATIRSFALIIASVHAMAVPLQSVLAVTCCCPCCATIESAGSNAGRDGRSIASGCSRPPQTDDCAGSVLAGPRANCGGTARPTDRTDCGICRCHGGSDNVSSSWARWTNLVRRHGPTAPRLPSDCPPHQPGFAPRLLPTADRLPSCIQGSERGILLCTLLL